MSEPLLPPPRQGVFPITLLLLTTLWLAGCATAPPADINNACMILDERPDWREEAQASFERWGVPVHVMLAIIHQESSFRSDARPPRERLFGFLPGSRPSTAFGYAQVLDATWDWYREKTGNSGADRDDFDDAVDFIGWYGALSHRRLGISKWDAYNQYLAYHEGHGGFERETFRRKTWLMQVAAKVRANAARFRSQMRDCPAPESTGWLAFLDP